MTHTHCIYIQNDVGVYRQPRCIESVLLDGVADTMRMSELKEVDAIKSNSESRKSILSAQKVGMARASTYRPTYT